MNDKNFQRLGFLQEFYDRLFTSGITLSKLRDAAIAERLYGSLTDSNNVAGRSLAWKLFLAKEEPLHASLPPRSSSLLGALRESRKAFAILLADKTRPPDAKPTTPSLLPNGTYPFNNLTLNDPLSIHDENPWNEWFSGLELKKVISQDVERTFPDIAFFRESNVQAQLTNILFLYSVTHPSIGYRQGMHELLAPLYSAIHYDAMGEEEFSDHYKDLAELCSSDFIAADAWGLFNTVMNGVSRWYEWQEDVQPRASSPFPNHVQFQSGQNGIQAYIAPIVQACNHIQNNLLQSCDPHLWKHIQKAGIEPQIYGIRWLRLLFTREFNMVDALNLWDGLFACDPSLDLAQWICVAMLIRIRNELIPADYSGQLTTLLRYPSPDPSYKTEGTPHHTILLLRQALALQMAPSPSTGAMIAMENRSLLSIPLEVPTSEPAKRQRVPRPPPMTLSSGSQFEVPGRGHARQSSSPAANLSELFTRNLVERSESLGINKTLMNAVTEIKRNIPELAASLGVRSGQQQATSFPLVDERPVEEKPPWEPRTRFEVEKEMVRLRSRDKTLGESLAWVVDALLQDEGEAQDASRVKLQKREALESLSYVRDVLMTSIMDLEQDRLLSGEERSRREAKAEKEKAELRAASASVIVAPPVPVPVIDSRGKTASSRPKARSPIPFGHSNSSHSDRPPERAPWNYTRSQFSNPTVHANAMPRPPPPTSTSLRRDVRKSSDQSPPPSYQDPLGALR